MITARPKMILFDYGGTLLCEPEWDMLRGEKALFEHIVSNPHHYTPEELCSWEKEYMLFSIKDMLTAVQDNLFRIVLMCLFR